MNASIYPSRSLSLESLESRTLLAGGFGFEADFNQAVAAVSGTGEFEASFSTNFGNKQLVLTGNGEETLTIDLDRLPAFVTNLWITSFSEVTFLGTDRVDTLIVRDVHSLVGSHLSVVQDLHSYNVGSIDLASTGRYAVLHGSHTDLTVDSLGNTTIFSDLQSLTLESESRDVYVVAMSSELNSEQTLNFKYRPENIFQYGFPLDAIHVLAPGGSPAGPGTAGPSPDTNVPGGGDPMPPATIPDPVVIITVPLDERTRAFIAELRDLLRTTPMASQQLVSAIINHGALSLEASPTSTARLLASSGYIPGEAEILARSIASPPALGDQSVEPKGSEGPAPASTDRSPAPFTDRPLDVTNALLHTVLSSPVVEIDATWPVAFAPSPASEIFHPAAPIRKGEQNQEQIKLEDSVVAFGNYIVERVATELSPGEQSHILLVDPRPSRSNATAPVSAMDHFARGSRTTLTALQAVKD